MLAAGAVTPEEFTVDNDERSIRKLVRRLDRDARGREIRICYERIHAAASARGERQGRL